MNSILTSSKKDFHVSSFENLVVSIYVIGYKNVGESIVVLFRDIDKSEESSVTMSMVIDCYKTQDFNLTKTILERHHVKYLDFVCWTHPHCDHSPGIDELISDCFSENIVIFTPKFHYANLSPDLLKSESEKTKNIFDNIWRLVDGHPNYKNIWRTISANGDITHSYPMKIVSDANNEEKPFVLYFLTPLGTRTDEYAVAGKVFNSPNELSVSFIMSLDGYNFYFGGDTENEHADGIESAIVKEMRWIKVPHHCSLGARSIAERLGPNFDFAASSVFTSANLPNEEIQKQYERAGTLHMTQLKESDKYSLIYEYGIIQYDYTFKDCEALVKITTYGNAGQFFSEATALSNSSSDSSTTDEF